MKYGLITFSSLALILSSMQIHTSDMEAVLEVGRENQELSASSQDRIDKT